jgi:hypothetical protein
MSQPPAGNGLISGNKSVRKYKMNRPRKTEAVRSSIIK